MGRSGLKASDLKLLRRWLLGQRSPSSLGLQTRRLEPEEGSQRQQPGRQRPAQGAGQQAGAAEAQQAEAQAARSGATAAAASAQASQQAAALRRRGAGLRSGTAATATAATASTGTSTTATAVEQAGRSLLIGARGKCRPTRRRSRCQRTMHDSYLNSSPQNRYRTTKGITQTMPPTQFPSPIVTASMGPGPPVIYVLHAWHCYRRSP